MEGTREATVGELSSAVVPVAGPPVVGSPAAGTKRKGR
jgi:hypothetical protein